MHDADRHFLHRLEKIAIFNHTYDLPRRHRKLCAYGSRNSPTAGDRRSRRKKSAWDIDREMLARNVRTGARPNDRNGIAMQYFTKLEEGARRANKSFVRSRLAGD